MATEEKEKLLLTVEEMKEKVEVTAGLGPKNSSLEEQLKGLNSLLQMRVTQFLPDFFFTRWSKGLFSGQSFHFLSQVFLVTYQSLDITIVTWFHIYFILHFYIWLFAHIILFI